MDEIAKEKYDNWRKLVSTRSRLEDDLLRVADEYLDAKELAHLDQLILMKDYMWVGFIFSKITDKANKGYKEMKEGQP